MTHLSPSATSPYLTLPRSRGAEKWAERFDLALSGCLVLMMLALPLSEALKNAAFGGACALWLLRVAVRRERIRVSSLGWGLLLFLAVAFLSSLSSLDRYQGIRGVWDVFRYVSTFFLVSHGLSSRQQIRWGLGALMLSAVLGAGVGLAQYISMEANLLPSKRLVSKVEAQASDTSLTPEERHQAVRALILSSLELGDSYKEIHGSYGFSLEDIVNVEKQSLGMTRERMDKLRIRYGKTHPALESILTESPAGTSGAVETLRESDRKLVDDLKMAEKELMRVNRGNVAVKVHSVGHPNHSATYLVMMFGLAFGAALERGFRPSLRASMIGAAALFAVATVFTYSRTALLVMVMVAAALLLFAKRGRWVLGMALLSLTLLALPSFRAQVPKVVSAVQDPMQVGAVYDRVHVWRRVVIGVLKDRPLVGAGPRNFNSIDKRRYGLGRAWDYFDHAHSLYMNTTAEMGLLGLGALLMMMGLFVRTWWSSRQKLNDPLTHTLWLGSVGAFLALALSGVMTTTLHTEGAMLLMAIWGLWSSARWNAEAQSTSTS